MEERNYLLIFGFCSRLAKSPQQRCGKSVHINEFERELKSDQLIFLFFFRARKFSATTQRENRTTHYHQIYRFGVWKEYIWLSQKETSKVNSMEMEEFKLCKNGKLQKRNVFRGGFSTPILGWKLTFFHSLIYFALLYSTQVK